MTSDRGWAATAVPLLSPISEPSVIVSVTTSHRPKPKPYLLTPARAHLSPSSLRRRRRPSSSAPPPLRPPELLRARHARTRAPPPSTRPALRRPVLPPAAPPRRPRAPSSAPEQPAAVPEVPAAPSFPAVAVYRELRPPAAGVPGERSRAPPSSSTRYYNATHAFALGSVRLSILPRTLFFLLILIFNKQGETPPVFSKKISAIPMS
ncbi:predicted GPI-anchored protein 58 [Miscanthus floridulus]|uniref:predicted GPI-anchored protein 58 n=1 Tax=Miscanthus floridulus TaxID=154761 RepID=UPI00345A9CF8